MNRWKKSIIVAGIFLAVGITGSIISGAYMMPKIVNKVYKVQQEIINATPTEREVFVTDEQVDAVDISSLENKGYNVEIKSSPDKNTRVKVLEYIENDMKVETSYDANTKGLKVVGDRTMYNFFEAENIRGFFEKSYDAIIYTLKEEKNDNAQIVIEVPVGVDVNFNSNYYTNLIIKDSKVLKDTLIFTSPRGGHVNLPHNNTLKNISIKTSNYLEIDLREFINAENIKIDCNNARVYSGGTYNDYEEGKVLPDDVTINADYIDIESYMPIGKNVILVGRDVNYTTDFNEYAMNVDLKDNRGGRVHFDGADLSNEENFNSVTSNSSHEGYIGRGKKKDFKLSVSGYDICEFEHSSTTDLEMELYN
ncbi:hypothetical protein [Clostridium sp.]|uniref:hypothetical protein n=1 Tax=Clostridium sp. TaxID=1506 RepID=UPI003463F76B